MASLVSHLDAAWRRVFGRHDSIRPPAASLDTCRRSARRVCGAVCTLSRLLAADVPAGGLAGIVCWNSADLARACGPDVWRRIDCFPILAGGGFGCCYA